jgi:hypothetical protein
VKMEDAQIEPSNSAHLVPGSCRLAQCKENRSTETA